MRRNRTTVLIWQLIIVGVFLALWSATSLSGIAFERLFPPPWQVGRSTIALLREGKFFSHLLFSLHEVAWGFALGALSGVIVELVLGANRVIGRIFEPIVLRLAPVPKIIVYPLFLWFLGIGIGSRIAMGVASAFFPVVIYTAIRGQAG